MVTPQQYLDHVAAESARLASSSIGNLDKTIDHLGWSGAGTRRSSRRRVLHGHRQRE